MAIIRFFESLKGVELVAYCGLLIVSMYFYLENVVPANVGTSSALASCAMAILTAGAIVKISRVVLSRVRKISGLEQH